MCPVEIDSNQLRLELWSILQRFHVVDLMTVSIVACCPHPQTNHKKALQNHMESQLKVTFWTQIVIYKCQFSWHKFACQSIQHKSSRPLSPRRKYILIFWPWFWDRNHWNSNLFVWGHHAGCSHRKCWAHLPESEAVTQRDLKMWWMDQYKETED